MPANFVNNSGVERSFDLNIRIKGTFSFRSAFSDLGSGSNITVALQVGGTQASLSPVPTTLQLVFLPAIVPGAINNIAFDLTYSTTASLSAGHGIWLSLRVTDIDATVSGGLFEFLGYTHELFEFDITTVSTVEATNAPLYKIYETGEAITQRITSLENVFRSSFLGRKNSSPESYDENGCFSFAGIMNGGHIRGLSVPLFCSMDQYYKSINAYYPCGIGFQKENDNYILRLEERDYFYDNTSTTLQCPFAKDIKTSVAKEYFVSDIFLGFNKWEVENINGLDEVNSKRTYTTGVKAIDNKLNIESPFVGGMYAIEITRRKGNNSTDTDYDNDNFIICTNRSVDGNGVPNNMGVAEKNENFSTVNNILAPDTSYNLRITPARSLIRHMKYIASSIYKQAGRLVRFTYGEANFSAQSALVDSTCINGNFNGQLLTENQDIAWDNANINIDPIYIPEYIEFEYPVSFVDYLTIKNNPYKCIEVSQGNSNFTKGFIIEVRWKPVGGIAYFKLLRAWQ